MRYYPVNLDIKGRKCLVVGGGRVGARKVKTLLECGAKVTVVSPKVHQDILDIQKRGEIELIKRPYKSSDIDTVFMVIGATDDERLNLKVYSDAEARSILCNIADRPNLCSFILPSIVKRGNLTISVSTSGKSPAFAKKLRKQLEEQITEEYGIFVDIMGEIREKLLSVCKEHDKNKIVFEKIVNSGLLEFIKNGEKEKIARLLSDILGSDFELERYGDNYGI